MHMINFYLLRGLSRESAHWGTFPTDLANKIPNSRVIQMDLPGVGELNQMNSPTEIQSMIDILKFNYFKHEGTNIFIASSLATMVALTWVQRTKDDFQGLVLLSPGLKGICKFTERIKPRSWYDCGVIMLHPSSKIREKKLLKINLNNSISRKEVFESWVEIQNKRPYKVKNAFRQLLAGTRFKLLDQIIDIPILISGSKKDKLVASACFIKLKIKLGADIALHDHAGHALTLDASAWLIEKIYNWQQAKGLA
jgi:alpha-beta hydrolase superfamily lysophospholipase